MKEYLLAVILGVLSSLIASAMWLTVLRGLRPSIEISSVIAEWGPSTSLVYHIKIVNRRKRAATDLGFEFSVMTPRPVKDGIVNVRRAIVFQNRPPLILPGRDKRNDDANAFRLRIGEGLRELLDSNPYVFLRFRVFARDEMSGIGKLFSIDFNDSGSGIKRGVFSKGQVIEIYEPD